MLYARLTLPLPCPPHVARPTSQELQSSISPPHWYSRLAQGHPMLLKALQGLLWPSAWDLSSFQKSRAFQAPPTRCRSLHCTRLSTSPDIRLPIAQATVCFLLLFCKQGRRTDHTDPAAPHTQDPNQVLLHPASSRAPSPRLPRAQEDRSCRLCGALAVTTAVPAAESCCYFHHTSLLSGGAAGLKGQGGSVLQSTSPVGPASLPWASSLS